MKDPATTPGATPSSGPKGGKGDKDKGGCKKTKKGDEDRNMIKMRLLTQSYACLPWRLGSLISQTRKSTSVPISTTSANAATAGSSISIAFQITKTRRATSRQMISPRTF
jgi:hypothetical protein